MKKRLTFLFLVSTLPFFNAQWSKAVPNTEISKKSDNSIYYKLDIDAIRGQLLSADKAGKNVGSVTISIPTSNGIEKFAVNSFPVMDEALANQYQLGSYVGVGIDDPSKYIRFSVAPNDFQSMIIGADGKYEFIEPATADKAYYSIHGKTSKTGAFVCGTKESPESIQKLNELMKDGKAAKAGNQKFRTLRLALSVTGEYGARYGGKAGALTQMNATMTRVNGVFEKEFNIHLNIINAPDIIFTNAATDPYSNANLMCKWNNELMNVLKDDTYGVGNSKFDIGHLFGNSGGGGNAGCIGCIGSNDTSVTNYNAVMGYLLCGSFTSVTVPNNYKGSGITSPGSGAPQGDAFDIDYVAHEMAHQLGANHTFSRSESGTNVNFEPGSGSTIMGYAGITGANTDVQAHSDAYFHTASIDQVQANLISKPTVGTETEITNQPPLISSLPTYTIPKSTAFVLTATATDPDGDTLSYCWEQVDNSAESSFTTKAQIGTLATGASFRSLTPTDSPTRYFPKLSTVLAGAVKNENDWEAASTVNRQTKFRVTVRDNKGVDSQTATATQIINVGTANAFTVSAASGVAGDPVTINWTVSGTTASPYNVANVKIDYTTNGGNTWNVLAASVPNDGSRIVTFPEALGASEPYVRVSAIENVFYAVNRVTLTAPTLQVADISKASMQVYPNPVKDVLNVTNVKINSSYEIFNAAGQLVSKGNLGSGKIQVNKLSKGVYFINVDDNGTIIKNKFIKE